MTDAPRAISRTVRPDLLVAAAVLAPVAWFLIAEHRLAGTVGFPLDDAWIHLHFARNLAEGAGFSYNPGHPVAGSTAPLWTLLLGGVVAIGGASVVLVKAIGLVITAGAGIVTRRAALAWGAPSPVALGVGVALVWTGPMAWGALSGMEVSLAALLVAAALWAHALERTVWTAALAGLAVLARPEAIVLLPLLVLARPLSARRLAIFLVVPALLLAPEVAFSLATVGAPVPATAAAKVEGGLLGWLGGVREPWRLMLVARPREFVGEWIQWLALTHWALPLALLPGLIVAAARRGRALGVVALALVLHPLAMALLAPYRGPAFQEGRYSIHLLPLAFIVLATVLPWGATTWRTGALVALLGLALIPVRPAADRYGWAVENINAMQVHLGHWIDRRLPRTARLAVNDIGAIAFASRREVVDLMGLVTPEILPYRREGERGVLRYVQRECPDYVVVFPTWFPEMTAHRDLLEPVYRVRLSHNTVAGGPEMVVYRLARCTV